MRRHLIFILLVSISAFAAAETPPPCTGEIRQFLVEVTSPGGEPTNFEGVIAYQGELEIINAATPYRFEFSASKMRAMFSSDTPVTASLYVVGDGGSERLGYITDTAPAILESVACSDPVLRVFGRF